MNKIKRVINFIIPVSACNFTCHYCYVGQEGQNTGKIEKLNYSLEHIQKAMSVERWGGSCYISMCGLGETLLPDYSIELTQRLLDNGHYVSIVTNGTLSNRINQLCDFPRELRDKLFIKFSFHYQQLKERNMLNIFFDNVRKIKETGISFTLEMTVNDEIIPDISDIKQICLKEAGAICHLAESRDNINAYARLTKFSIEEHLNTWSDFSSPMFDFQQTTWLQKRTEFCYAGDWLSMLYVGSGRLVPCFCGGEVINENVFENIDEPIKFLAIGNNCPWAHCQCAHTSLSFGTIPELITPTYTEFRDRICDDGTHWLTPFVKDFYSSKLIESNKVYSLLKKSYINQLIRLIYKKQNNENNDATINIVALRQLMKKKKIQKVVIWGTGKFRDFLIQLFDETKIKVLCSVDYQNTYNVDKNLLKRILRKTKWSITYHLPSFFGKKIYNGRIVKNNDIIPKVDTIIVTDFAKFNNIKKTIPVSAKRVLSITELCDDVNTTAIHFSIDDFWEPFRNITENNYSSIFENSFFEWLRSLHQNYGINITLYCFFEENKEHFDLTKVTDCYKKEFENNSNWLQFGFHSRNADSRYSEKDKNTLYHDYIETNKELERIVGRKSITDTLRIHWWQGTKEEINKIRNDSAYPLRTLLSSDVGNKSYYLDKIQMKNLNSNFYIHDKETGLEFYKTDLRIENIQDVHKLSFKKLRTNHKKQITIFTHAWALYDTKVGNDTTFILEKLVM